MYGQRGAYRKDDDNHDIAFLIAGIIKLWSAKNMCFLQTEH